MGFIDQLPAPVARAIRTRFVCQFATVSAAGDPIGTPLVPFASPDLATIDAATGLAYPAKAERARRNPRVGLLFTGGDDEPVVSIAARAAVRDRDFQANLERYLAEEILTTMLDPATVDYAGVTRHAIWYFTRILISASPAVVRWWDSPAAMDGPPREWRAPAGTPFPASDPAPTGRPSASPWRAKADWRALADQAIARGARAHLTLIDAAGYALPMPARAVRRHPEGFAIDLPRWRPWDEGRACVTFDGIETFIGTATFAADGTALFRAGRALPVHPLMADPGQILRPTPETRAALMARIAGELARRGASLPRMPDSPPAPTAGALLRAEAARAFGILPASPG